MRKDWPLGLRFATASRSRTFEVVETYYGEEGALRIIVELNNGHTIYQQLGGDFPQTKVGFVDIHNRGEVFREPIADMIELIRNRKIIYV